MPRKRPTIIAEGFNPGDISYSYEGSPSQSYSPSPMPPLYGPPNRPGGYMDALQQLGPVYGPPNRPEGYVDQSLQPMQGPLSQPGPQRRQQVRTMIADGMNRFMQNRQEQAAQQPYNAMSQQSLPQNQDSFQAPASVGPDNRSFLQRAWDAITGLPGQAANAISSGIKNVGETMGGKEGQFKSISPYTKENQALFDTLITQLLGRIGKGLGAEDKFDFGPIAQRAQTRFQQETIPSIAERFTGLGAGGGRSSAMSQTLGRAGVDLQEALAALESKYAFGREQNALQQQGLLQNLLNLGRYDTAYSPRVPGWGEILGGNIARGAGAAGVYGAGKYMGIG